MRLRYAGACRLCACELPQGADAVYEKSTKTVRCVACSESVPTQEVGPISTAIDPSVEVDLGVPGASARREFERRAARREEQIRTKHKRLGGFILAVSDDPQSTRAWDTGAIGEERLGARLNELVSDSLRVLHDRRIPRSTANIDHLAVTPNGVFVIDAKRYRGRPTLIVEGGLIRPRIEKLTVAGRDRTKVVDGVIKQVEVVRGLVGPDVTIRGVLCFVEADWPLIGGSFTTREVDVLWPKKLYPRLHEQGPLTTSDVAKLHEVLAHALRPA
jgi:hypothetical protein